MKGNELQGQGFLWTLPLPLELTPPHNWGSLLEGESAFHRTALLWACLGLWALALTLLVSGCHSGEIQAQLPWGVRVQGEATLYSWLLGLLKALKDSCQSGKTLSFRERTVRQDSSKYMYQTSPFV